MTKIISGFSAKKLLNLKKSDLDSVWAEGIELIKIIQEHYAYCAACRERFDAMAYDGFSEFEKILSNSTMSDWICEEEEEGGFNPPKYMMRLKFRKRRLEWSQAETRTCQNAQES